MDNDALGEYKQVIVVNMALRLPIGKVAAQVAHASVGAFLSASHAAQVAWLNDGMPKVVLKGSDEDALLQLLAQAESAGVPALLIRDAGRTVVAAGTITCLGIGPAQRVTIDAITGTLRLL